MSTQTRYVQTSDGRYVAYQVSGDGPLDLLLMVGHGISVEDQMNGRECRAFIERLETFARVIRFDRRGTGMSDPITTIDQQTWEVWVEDAWCVCEAVGAREVAVVSPDMTATPVSVMLAATSPDRVRQLVLYNPGVRFIADEEYPWGFAPGALDAFLDGMLAERLGDERAWAFSMLGDDEWRTWFRGARWRGTSPSVAVQLYRNGARSDMRAVLPAIRVPTLVLLRQLPGGVPLADVEGPVRYVADRIEGAKLVEVPGEHPVAYAADAEPVLAAIQEFLTGTRAAPPTDRVLATVLFTDLVGSTEQAARLGDDTWRRRLDAHDAIVRAQLESYRGREVKHLGDGVLATFDGPARAVACGRAIVDALRPIGLDVRVGVHTGEIERRGEDVGGVAVHIAARVLAHAGAGEVVVSRTVVDLVAGAGLEFSDRGEHELKGIPDTWRLFQAR